MKTLFTKVSGYGRKFYFAIGFATFYECVNFLKGIKMKYKITLFLAFFLMILYIHPVECKDNSSASPAADSEKEKKVDEILDCLEKRYGGKGFSALFFQASTLQAMKITDTANGRAFFKDPGMMRWEYLQPDRQQIITDGVKLWIYRPDDRQVTVGEFPSFFGDGKGAGFLSNIGLIRKKFLVSLGDSIIDSETMLKVWPRGKNIDLSVIHLFISRDTCDVVRLVTYNSYGDETRIEFTDISFTNIQPDDFFHFEIPPGTDIIKFAE